MTDIFFTSDWHLFHKNILTFTGDDGKLIRPEFENVEHMNNHIIDEFNKLVKPQDKVYHLGDVSFKYGEQLDQYLSRLNGHLRLVVGNHDDLRQPTLMKHFEKITLWRIFKEHNFTGTHVPMRLDEMRKTKFNVHGHTHQRNVLLSPFEREIEDKNYINVCVEKTNYKPVHLDTLLHKMKNR